MNDTFDEAVIIEELRSKHFEGKERRSSTRKNNEHFRVKERGPRGNTQPYCLRKQDDSEFVVPENLQKKFWRMKRLDGETGTSSRELLRSRGRVSLKEKTRKLLDEE